MAVPGRRNGGVNEDDDGQDPILEEVAMDELEEEDEVDVPPHLEELYAATQLGDVDALRHALDNLNGNIDEPIEDGDTALHLSCLYGFLPCVNLLLERGASLESEDEEGAIPLHDACAGGFTEIIQLLINQASSQECLRMLDSVDAEGDTPLHHAARGEHIGAIRALLAAGASPSKRNLYGKTPGELIDADTEARRILENGNYPLNLCHISV